MQSFINISLKTKAILIFLTVSILILVVAYWYFNNTAVSSVAPIEQQPVIKLTNLDLAPIALGSSQSSEVSKFTQQKQLPPKNNSVRMHSKSDLEDYLTRNKIYSGKLDEAEMLTTEEVKKIILAKDAEKGAREKLVKARWNEPRGISERKISLYASYDEETLRSLATQGDIYAMQTIANIEFDKMNFKNSSSARWLAAVEGSVGALFEQGDNISVIVSVGKNDLNLVAKDYRIKHPPGKAREALIMLAAAYYTVGQFRGNIKYGYINKKILRSFHFSGRDFTAEEEENIYIISRALYEKLSKAREKRGLPVFDNSYMPNYREGTLPQENNFMEEYFNSFKNLNP